jgi:predicted nucleic acid-binding protein
MYHLRCGLLRLATSLQNGEVLIHPWVIGELAYGHLHDRQQVLSLLQGLPAAVVASDEDVLLLIEHDQLVGRGIGYVDTHMIASARLSRCRLWTQDCRFAAVAEELGLGVPAAEPG